MLTHCRVGSRPVDSRGDERKRVRKKGRKEVTVVVYSHSKKVIRGRSSYLLRVGSWSAGSISNEGKRVEEERKKEGMKEGRRKRNIRLSTRTASMFSKQKYLQSEE